MINECISLSSVTVKFQSQCSDCSGLGSNREAPSLSPNLKRKELTSRWLIASVLAIVFVLFLVQVTSRWLAKIASSHGGHPRVDGGESYSTRQTVRARVDRSMDVFRRLQAFPHGALKYWCASHLDVTVATVDSSITLLFTRCDILGSDIPDPCDGYSLSKAGKAAISVTARTGITWPSSMQDGWPPS